MEENESEKKEKEKNEIANKATDTKQALTKKEKKKLKKKRNKAKKKLSKAPENSTLNEHPPSDPSKKPNELKLDSPTNPKNSEEEQIITSKAKNSTKIHFDKYFSL